jgi:hypothetical protein
VGSDHAEITSRSLLQRTQSCLEVAHFGGKLAIALDELLVGGLLRRDGSTQPIEIAYAILGQPNPVLQ